MKSVVLGIALSALASGAVAASFTVETSSWLEAASPAANSLSGGDWATGGTSASRGGNNSASLVSDFSTTGDFTYTGTMRATADNDNMGIVFGWTDNQNNWRMGWEGGGFFDGGSSLENGWWLIREVGGVDTVLANIPTLFWVQQRTYDFTITRSGNNIGYSIAFGGADVVSGSVVDATPMAGRVGVYIESNNSVFTDLAVRTPDVGRVPVPAALPLLAAGLGALGMLRRRGRAA